ncbi:MAG: PQQ-like beta-propeller repeat protein [Streptomyces sp.]|nr:PQQ-like beta-propeller repeat protein [Streptomyces sp.]
MAVIAGLAAGGWALWFRDSADRTDDIASTKAAPQQAADDIRESVEPKPKGGAGHMIASVVTKDLEPKQRQAAPGTWATEKFLVKGRYDRLEAVKIGEDTEAWTTVLPGPICGYTSMVTVAEKTAVLFRDKAHGDLCNQVGFIDLDTGKLLWKSSFPGKSKLGATVDPTDVTMTRGVVVTAWQAQGAAGFDMKNGRKLWQRNRAEKCYDLGFQGGRALGVVRSCSSGSNDEFSSVYQVQRLDPRTGRAQWTYRVTKGVRGVSLISSQPAVIGVGAGGEGQITDLISLSDKGKYRATIRLEGDHYEVDCDTFFINHCSQVVVGKEQAFITSSEQVEGVNDTTNWIVGFDLATGKSRMKFDAGDDRMIYPVRMSGDALLAYKVSTDTYAPNSLVSPDPATGKQHEYFYFNVSPDTPGLVSGGSADDVVIEGGRIFFGYRNVVGEGDKGNPSMVTTGIGIGHAK